MTNDLQEKEESNIYSLPNKNAWLKKFSFLLHIMEYRVKSRKYLNIGFKHQQTLFFLFLLNTEETLFNL